MNPFTSINTEILILTKKIFNLTMEVITVAEKLTMLLGELG